MRRDAESVRVRLRAEAAASGGQRALSRKIGCSPAFLNDILLCKREPSGKPLIYLHLKRIVSYEPI